MKLRGGERTLTSGGSSKESYSIQIRVQREHRGQTAKVNLGTGQKAKKLNVFAQITGLLSFRLQISDGRGNLGGRGGARCFPKVRLDALTDGVFAVAMTLLVLDVRLPDDFHPANGGELLMRMVTLTPELEHGDHLRRRLTSAAFLAVSSLVAVVLSFVDPNIALWGFALNFAQPVFERWRRRSA